MLIYIYYTYDTMTLCMYVRIYVGMYVCMYVCVYVPNKYVTVHFRFTLQHFIHSDNWLTFNVN